MQRAEGWLRLALEAADASAWEWDIANGRVAWSEREFELLGAAPAQVNPSYEGFLHFVHPDDRARVVAYVNETVATRREHHEQEFRVVRPDGEVRHVLSRARLSLDAEERPVRPIGIDVDITERKRLQDALQRSEAQFRAVLAHAPVVVFTQDRDLRYTWVYNSLLGIPIEEMIGKTDADLFTPAQAEMLQAAKRRVLQTGVAERIETVLSRARCTIVCDLYLAPLREGGQVVGISCAGTDVTERRLRERQIERMAMHDPLLMLIDLDDYKAVNDTYGHAIGDRLLIEIAVRLRGCVREGDLVARLGGDEFAIIADCLDDDCGGVLLADRVVERLGEHVRLGEIEFRPGASVGLTVAPCDTGDPDELLCRADQALYTAKTAGRRRWVVFGEAIPTAADLLPGSSLLLISGR